MELDVQTTCADGLAKCSIELRQYLLLRLPLVGRLARQRLVGIERKTLVRAVRRPPPSTPPHKGEGRGAVGVAA